MAPRAWMTHYGSRHSRSWLGQAHVAKDPEVKAAVLISGKPDNFIAGADIKFIDTVSDFSSLKDGTSSYGLAFTHYHVPIPHSRGGGQLPRSSTCWLRLFVCLAVCLKGHATFQKIRASKKPIVSAIHGPALGGGLEVTLYRYPAKPLHVTSVRGGDQQRSAHHHHYGGVVCL